MKIRLGIWDNRKKQFLAREVDEAELEGWRNTPGRIHFAEPVRATHDTSGLDHDRPVAVEVKSFKIGHPLEQGVVVDKRMIAYKMEYLLKPHTKTTRKAWQDRVKRQRIADIERLLEPDYDDYREREDAPALREEMARLRTELDLN